MNLFIWAEYTSKPMLEEFTKKTGIKVNESNYASNEELLAKLQTGATGFDLAVPSDYMVSVMAKLALVQELDKSQIPNAADLDPKFLGKTYDPQNKVSLPYGWAITGFAVNRSLYDGPAASWADLLQNEKVKGRVSLLDDVREALATTLKLQGSSLNTQNPEELARAKAALAAAKKKNIKTFNSTPADILTAGEVLIAQMYSTEALVAARDSEQDWSRDPEGRRDGRDRQPGPAEGRAASARRLRAHELLLREGGQRRPRHADVRGSRRRGRPRHLAARGPRQRQPLPVGRGAVALRDDGRPRRVHEPVRPGLVGDQGSVALRARA